MNLYEAFKTVQASAQVESRSDRHLASTVNAKIQSPHPHLSPATSLHGPQTVRLEHVLLRLAHATSPMYDRDVYDVSAFWSLLRYLGVFALDPLTKPPTVGLSDAGRRVAGNQRRVLSEELGIGFAVLMAEEWVRDLFNAYGAVRTVDVDIALTNANIATARGHKSFKQVGTGRPDYILLLDDPNDPGRTRIGFLECKGTKSSAHSIVQLAHASAQLGGLNVGGRHHPGLAVSSVLNDTDLYLRALELIPPRLTLASGDGQAWGSPLDRRWTEEDVIEVDPEALSNPAPGHYQDGTQEMARTAMQASFAFLAEFSGNEAALDVWAPPMVRRRINETRPRPLRREEVLSDGTRLVGTSRFVRLPGGAVEVFLGIPEVLDQALAERDPETVLGLQRSLTLATADRLTGRQGIRIEAIASDGAALVITPL